MASLSKKRKEPSQSRTIIDFFSSNASTKKSKLQKTPFKPNKKNFEASLSREIIIIDSDSDDCTTKRDKGKTRVISGVQKQRATPEGEKGNLRHSNECGEWKPSLARVALSNHEELHDDNLPTFGKPSALLQVPVQSSMNTVEWKDTSLQSSVIKASSSSSIFGVPTSLLRSAVGTAHELLFEGKVSTEVGVPKPCKDLPHSIDVIDIDFIVENEQWGVGDDEVAILEAANDDTEMEDVSEQLNDRVYPASPVCEPDTSHVLGLERQHHVNTCLDSTATSSSAITFTTSDLDVPCEPSTSKLEDVPSTDLYSILMASHKENEAWKEADLAEGRSFRPTRAPGSRRKAPFYKVLQGMPIAVDAFRYGTIPGVTAYFLTHAHSDHYTNLASNWKSGPIYCSADTANLIIHMLSVDSKWVHPLPMDVPTIVPDSGGVTVTLIEANHCPGSCLFLFEGPQTVHAGDSAFKSPFVGSGKVFRYLHCGDFRASPQHVMHPAVKGKQIDHVYLDTTYLDPKYTFPPQPLVISACAELAKRIVSGEWIGAPDTNGKRNSTMDAWVIPSERADDTVVKQPKDRMLVVVGTYSIGKERIVKAIAQALKTKIYCDAHKAAILRCQSDPELHALLTKDPSEAGVHVVPLSMIVSDKLKAYMQRFNGIYSRAVGFRPTGWTYTPPPGSDLSPPIPSIISRGQSRSFTHADLKPMQKSTFAVQMYGVPYSEHSSFFELTCFAMSCDWVKMIATVNVGNERSRMKMAKWVERWEIDKKRSKEAMVKPRAADYW